MFTLAKWWLSASFALPLFGCLEPLADSGRSQSELTPKISIIARRSVQNANLDNASLHKIYRKACHNCFERKYSLSVADILNNTSILEFDFWDDEIAPWFGGRPNAWYVRHDPWQGNDNICTQRQHAGNDLEACLNDVRRLMDDHRGHRLIVLFLDKKQGWGASRTPIEFDALLERVFDTRLFRPKELQKNGLTVRRSVELNGWPTTSQLTDRVVVALTGGSITAKTNNDLVRYLNDRGLQAAAFVAPDVLNSIEVMGPPVGIPIHVWDAVVIINIQKGHEEAAQAAHERNILSRVWAQAGVNEDQDFWNSLVAKKVNFIALFNYKLPLSEGVYP